MRSPTAHPGRRVALGLAPIGILAAAAVLLVVSSPADDSASPARAPAQHPSTTVRDVGALDPGEVNPLTEPVFPVGSALIDYLASRSEWVVGDLETEVFLGAISRGREPLAGALDSVQSSDAILDDTARSVAMSALHVYGVMFAVDESAARESDENVRFQLVRMGGRLRVLADRLFDEASLLETDDIKGPTLPINRVPDWTDGNITPGPPLARAQIPSGSPSSRSEPDAAASATGGLETPTPPPESDLRDLLVQAADLPAAQNLAQEFFDAEAELRRASSGPTGEDERTYARLAMLLYADSALLVGSHAIAEHPTPRSTAVDLAIAGDTIWSALLPRRTSTPIS